MTSLLKWLASIAAAFFFVIFFLFVGTLSTVYPQLFGITICIIIMGILTVAIRELLD